MAKIFYTDGVGAQQTLNESDSNKMKIYDDYNSIDTSELVDGEIVSTKETSADGSNVYDYINEQIESAASYSTTETLTGGKWIDGKPIYRKVVDAAVSSLPVNSWATISSDTVISSIDRLIYCFGVGDVAIPAANFRISGNNLQAFSSAGLTTGTDTKYILEYTKTTD